MRYYNSNASGLWLVTPSVVLSLLGAASAVLAAFAVFVRWTIRTVCGILHIDINNISSLMLYIAVGLCVLSVGLFTAAIIVNCLRTDSDRIRYFVRRKLYLPKFGNPLGLRDGEKLPKVICRANPDGSYTLDIYVITSAVNSKTVEKAVPDISSGITDKFSDYAVTACTADAADNFVSLRLDNVAADRSITANCVENLLSDSRTKLTVQQKTEIDLTTSGSMLVAGKTRSGKTTGIISLLLQVLARGRDAFGSSVVIIDPKQAELSRLPHTVTLDADGGAREILQKIKDFATSISVRQKVLNDLSEERGDAIHWWEADMNISLLFIDEYLALRTIFPKKADKNEANYSLDEFDYLLRRIVTMGASAGAYVILSTAEASVESGGLPAVIRSAMSTKILFRPTLPEARLMWDSQRLEALSVRNFKPGDAWFSSTDGVHDDVSFVHFPHMEFRVYERLGTLLKAYYGD